MSSEGILGMLDQSGIRHRNYLDAVKSTYFWHPDHPEIQNTIKLGTQGRDEFDRVMNEDLKMRMQATAAVIDALRTVQESLNKAHKKSGNFENRHGNPLNTEGVRKKTIGIIVTAPYKTSKGEDFGQCDFLFTRKYGSDGFKYNSKS